MRRSTYLGAALAYMALIYWVSDRPGSAVGIPAPWDKLAHALAYAGLGWLLGRGTGRAGWAWGIAAAYGVLDELHQARVPGREADLWDGVADALGAGLGVWWARPRRG
ncbi:VanZ family protein [Marinithermus hydrothermalis]|uniref:VanZ family protein n=1 Tax=Marinithermus hydrothermalis (strain DSM 14884 / JCM 11576 / T1) TaxID=869210 RepID=F2NKX3_MARHT|nr:VanZ family protein [Marinithermus hydrothermalis]AEB11162.1 VanZ family protein [Marinithermus hydrothermalis DSM 14884]